MSAYSRALKRAVRPQPDPAAPHVTAIYEVQHIGAPRAWRRRSKRRATNRPVRKAVQPSAPTQGDDAA